MGGVLVIGTKQLLFGNDRGDCHRACICSILEIPNSNDLPNIDDPMWPIRWSQALEPIGLDIGSDDKAIWREGYWIASVPSLNIEGKTHSIVMLDSEVAFDPSNQKTYKVGRNMLGASESVTWGWWLEVSDISKFKAAAVIPNLGLVPANPPALPIA